MVKDRSILARLRTAVYLCLVALLVATGCAKGNNGTSEGSTTSEKKKEMTLEITFSASAKPPLGFGYVFACDLLQPSPELPEQGPFLLTIMVADKDILAVFGNGGQFRGSFELHSENVERNTLPITGFVDQQKRAWKLVKVEPA